MEQVRVFTDDRFCIQESINTWLQKNPDIEIIERLQSELTGKKNYIVISIFYKKKE